MLFIQKAWQFVLICKHYYLRQGRSHWEGTRGPWFIHVNFRTEQGPKVLFSNTTDTNFYVCSDIILTGNLTIFAMYATIFVQFMADFLFFSNYIEIGHFTLDLLKWSELCKVRSYANWRILLSFLFVNEI